MHSEGLISNINKCEVCAEAKQTSVFRESKLLSLIHTDLGDEVKPFYLLVIYKIEFLIRKRVKLLMSCGKGIHLIWNIWKCGGALLKLCCLILRKEKIGSKTSDCMFIGYAESSAHINF